MRRSSSGDRPLDDDLRALVLAAREAMVNAAKHAGVDEVDVYAEVEPDEVNVFVRDRGAGLRPRRRARRPARGAPSPSSAGWRATAARPVRSTPGEGTEVRLR